MNTVTRHFDFCAAHRLQHHDGKCRRLHGHNYVATIVVEGEIDPQTGMVVDFGTLKERVGEWIDKYWDHRTLLQRGDPYIEALQPVVNWEDGELYLFDRPPTAEVLAMYLQQLVQSIGLSCVFVRVQETPKCSAESH